MITIQFLKIYDKNFLIINIGLKQIVSTQFHKIEFDKKVPYRYNKILEEQSTEKKSHINILLETEGILLIEKKF